MVEVNFSEEIENYFHSENIIGVGVDCTEISRFDYKLINNQKFLNKIFTNREIDYCDNKPKPSQHFAVRWAGKEAVLKALSKEGIRVPFKSIEIIIDANKRPKVKILNKNWNKKFKIHISLSHSENIAIAFVVFTKKSN